MPAHHLEELLTRSQNPFDVSDAVLDRLRSSVMYRVELRSWRHRNTPRPKLRCSSYRHVFLLADGSTLLLWELRYDSAAAEAAGRGAGGELCEVYTCEESLRRSERRVHSRLDNPSFGSAALVDLTASGDGCGGLDGLGPTPERDEEPPLRSFEFLITATGAAARGRREYTEHDSADHARRLLRRAENEDRPGKETLRLLSEALGHQILHVPGPLPQTGECHVWCSVYEHAFLLPDGSEVSLYELEHNLSGNGHLVCEVYMEQAVAGRAAHRLARDRGIDL